MAHQLLPERVLEGKVVLPIITESTPNHAYSADQILRPALSALNAQKILPTVYVNENDVKFDLGQVYIAERSQNAVMGQLQRFVRELRVVTQPYAVNPLRSLTLPNASTLLDFGLPA